jgi:hypothetical protein
MVLSVIYLCENHNDYAIMVLHSLYAEMCEIAIMLLCTGLGIINMDMQQNLVDDHIFQSVKKLGIARSGQDFSRLLGRSESYLSTIKSTHRLISADSLFRLHRVLSQSTEKSVVQLGDYVMGVATDRARLPT